MSRLIDKEVFIDATPDAVWRALTDAAELTRWFPVDARVEGGLNGSVWLSWGSGTEGSAPITAWEPGRRFGWTEDRGTTKLVVDFHLEPKGTGTIVRLVQSGFGAGPDWDAEFHMTEGGWAYFVQHLRWYLERHAGHPREIIVFREPVTFAPADAYRRLTEALGLSDAGEPGATFSVNAADAQPLSGEVLARQDSTGQLGVTISELSDATLFLEMEPGKDGCRAGFWLSIYQLPPSALAEARTRFGQLYTRALELV